MALLRFESGLDPLGALLGLQEELERFMRNPTYRTRTKASGKRMTRSILTTLACSQQRQMHLWYA